MNIEKYYTSKDYNLGYAYHHGVGVEKNEKLALEHYQKAADNYDHILANFSLGHCYQHGIGVTIDHEKAFEFYKKTFDKGLPEGTYMMAATHGVIGPFNVGRCFKHDSNKTFVNERNDSSLDSLFFEMASMCYNMSHTEYRREIHIQSERNRRAEIKDGFEELRRQLPATYTGRKMKLITIVNFLCKAVSHLKNQPRKESFLLDEINRLTQICVYLNAELEKERRMNELDRRNRTLDIIYAAEL
ncbi:mlx-interacting protein [Gigaspora margarita]|uniref:Mlx-interacting protein n=1 Tax=Gigaspora margarita TaxID=4874 RepID=A0A8H4AVJ1_GIGMA|nr:mlx-interacting protein [Gigaspora margarita]